jgi:hypothetical protein
VNAVKILAEEGFRCFQFIADYTAGVTAEDGAFESFIDSAEAWILAEASLAGGSDEDEREEREDREDREEETELMDKPDADDDTAWE